MDPRWQPHLGPVLQAPTPEACALAAAGWQAQHDECWIASHGRPPRMVSLQTWRSLRDRLAFAPPRLQLQRA